MDLNQIYDRFEFGYDFVGYFSIPKHIQISLRSAQIFYHILRSE